MTLLSHIGFSYTHHLVALSRDYSLRIPETKMAAIRQIK